LNFNESVESYKKNLSTAFGFALLLVFVAPFVWLSNAFISSGTVLINYGFLKEPLVEAVLLLIGTLLFLYFYALFVCLMVFSVRKDLSNVRISYFLNEKIHKLAFKYFRFLAIFTVVAAIVSSLLIDSGIPIEIINAILFVIASSFLFLAQTIVVDEESLRSSIISNWEFLLKNIPDFIFVMVIGIVSVFVLQLVEFVIDYFLLVGNFFSLLVALIFLVPFLEVLKTRIYMKRFDLIKSYHYSKS